MNNLGSIFVTGLLTGGLTCMAVQGSLLAAALLTQEKRFDAATSRKYRLAAIAAFLFAKLVAYTILGLLLGWLGSFIAINTSWQLALTVVVSLFMIGVALNMLDLHPVFRYFSLRTPKFIARYVRNRSRSDFILTPAILGLLTVFLPCGTTQAMMVLSVGSGSAIGGAMIMASFVLGTTPSFFLLGFVLTKARDFIEQKFMKIAAVAIILLAVWNLDSAVALSGSSWTLTTALNQIKCAVSFCGSEIAENTNAVTEASINFDTHGYTVDKPVIKAGEKIKVTLQNDDAYGCIQVFTIPKLGIKEIVRTGETKEIEFTAPNEPGELAFMCGMGMYRGAFIVR